MADLHDFSNDDNAISAFQSEADFAVRPRTALAPAIDDDALACFAPELVLPAIALESPAVDHPLDGLSVFPEEIATEHSDSAVTAAKMLPSGPIQRWPKTWRLATVAIVVTHGSIGDHLVGFAFRMVRDVSPEPNRPPHAARCARRRRKARDVAAYSARARRPDATFTVDRRTVIV